MTFNAGNRWGITWVATVALMAALTGCASYDVPGRGAQFSRLGVTEEQLKQNTDAPVADRLERKPLARFPTALAIARVQEPGYQSQTSHSYGRGAYSVVTTRDIETEAHLDRLAKLPMVTGVAPMNRLLLPSDLKSDLDLRQAAAALHADLLLIYTIDTAFVVRDHMTPLTVVSLGLFPTQNAEVVTTASAVLMDTRNGYVYGLAEATSRKDQVAAAWTSEDAVDQVRLKTEAQAFEQLIGEFEKTWGRVLKTYNQPIADVK
jgi:hypothetical protein